MISNKKERQYSFETEIKLEKKSPKSSEATAESTPYPQQLQIEGWGKQQTEQNYSN